VEELKKALIVSDGKKGHLNQSIAFCFYIDKEYDILEVKFKNKFFKLLSYMLDKVGLYTILIFIQNEILKRVQNDSVCRPEPVSGSRVKYDLVVCAGSGTYYAAKTVAKKLGIKSISMMLPRGYKYDFDVIFAQTHDNPPRRSNIIEIPANFSHIKPLGLYKPNKRSIGIVIGGNNSVFKMDAKRLKEQLDFIVSHYKDHKIAITTSPRTSIEIEELCKGYKFDYEVIYSENPINPIPDFLENCETIFITSDSTSMISEAISYGKSNVVVLPLESTKTNKFQSFIASLEKDSYLHIFNGMIIHKNRKIDFASYAKKAKL